MFSTDEPAVLTWMVALSPRPRHTTHGRHWWREFVTASWRAAYDAWQVEAETVAIGYATELEEFKALKPVPRLSDFMRHLSAGRLAPERALP